MAEPVHKSQYKGALTNCKHCGRVIGVDQVNTRGRCDICSPPRADHSDDDDDKEPAAA